MICDKLGVVPHRLMKLTKNRAQTNKFSYLLLNCIDGGALGGNGLELVGHELQVLGRTGLHTENAAGGEAVDEGSSTNVLAGQLLADQGIQNLERLACFIYRI